MTTKETSNDVDALSPEPDTVTLESGFVVRVDHLKTRGMLKLLKIVTRGGGPILMQMPMDFEDPQTFMKQFLAVVVMAIPEAEDETIEFVRFMVTPAEYNSEARAQDKAALQKNEDLFKRLAEEFDDPDPLDFLTVIEKIVENESADILALGKRLAAVLKIQTASLEAKN